MVFSKQRKPFREIREGLFFCCGVARISLTLVFKKNNEGGHVMEFPSAVMGHAREFVARSIYVFSELEQRVLRSFFTNTDRRGFFLHSLPSHVAATPLALYFRIKNSRGVRGGVVENF